MSSVGAVIENAIFGSPVPGRDSASRWRIVASLLGAMFLGLVVRVLFSPVFTGSDDVVYAHRGLEIANGIWRPTDYYGELRYGINLPIAFFIELFGANHIGYIGWSLFCSVLELGLVFLAARYFWGLRTALVVGVLIALTPLHVGLGARALSDAPLALFVTLAMLSQLRTRASEVSTAIFIVTLYSSLSMTESNYNKFDGIEAVSYDSFFTINISCACSQ